MTKTKMMTRELLLLAAAVTILSCASPAMQMGDNWRNSAYTGPAYKKIMVVAMTKQNDLRQPIEDEFAKQLRSRGVEATTCHECIPDPEKVTREELVKVSQGMGVDAYLIVRAMGTGIDIQTTRSQSPSPVAASTGGDSMMNMQWFGPEPSMTKRSQVVTLESRLYDGKSAEIVWRSTVDAVNPSPSEGQISKFVSLEVRALGDKKLIP
ncbi:MAG TPA: hypothetical protein VMB77_09195 [Syntrophales bacterium]|nr:hypothetical protein [Syntrophales bacterium]